MKEIDAVNRAFEIIDTMAERGGCCYVTGKDTIASVDGRTIIVGCENVWLILDEAGVFELKGTFRSEYDKNSLKRSINELWYGLRGDIQSTIDRFDSLLVQDK